MMKWSIEPHEFVLVSVLFLSGLTSLMVAPLRFFTATTGRGEGGGPLRPPSTTSTKGLIQNYENHVNTLQAYYAHKPLKT